MVRSRLWSAFLWTAPLALAPTLAACGGGGGGDTLVLVQVQRGTTLGPVFQIDLELSLGGQSHTRLLRETAGTEITLPTEALFGIRTASGELGVIAIARDSAGVELQRGSAFGQVSRGQTTTITVVLGSQVGSDAGVPDGGADASLNAQLEVDRTMQDYGLTTVGQASAPASLTVRNAGSSTSGTVSATITGADASAFELQPFTCDGQSLSPGGTCALSVIFRPATAAAASAQLTVTATPGGSVTVALSGQGATAGALTATPTSLDFATVVVGGPGATMSVQFRNSGGTPTTAITTALSGTGASSFSLSADTCSGQTVAAGAMCQVTVRFQPTASGSRTAALAAMATQGGTATVSLTGTGQPAAALTITPPTPPSFGSVALGGSADRVFIVSNGGSQATGPITPSLTGADAAQFMLLAPTGGDCVPGTTSLSAAATCTVQVRFTPASLGTKAAQLMVAATPGGSASSALDGTGIAAGSLTGSPSSLNLGSSDTGVVGSSGTWTLTNSGGAATGVPTLTMSGNTGDFTVTNGCSAALGPSQTCTVTFRFMPTTAGSRTATYTMTASPGGSAQVTVSGTGTYRLTISKPGTGTGTVTATGIDCGSDCTESFTANAVVTLQARSSNGSNSYFQGWSGDCSGSVNSCTVTMSGARTVSAVFAPQTYNLIFMASTPQPATLGGALAYDTRCNSMASTVGINDATGGNFVAWMSDGGSSAVSRLGAARGWVRMDGKAVIDDLTSLFTQSKIFNPVRLDENGRDTVSTSDSSMNMIFTGADHLGVVGSHCTNWSSTAGSGNAGSLGGGPRRWSNMGTWGCGATLRFYCMGKTKSVALTPTTTAGKKIWMTNTTWDPGTGVTADNKCLAERPAGVASAKAFLSTMSVPASMAITLAQTYVRPDGQVVGTGAQLATNGGAIQSGIWQSADGTYVSNIGTLWTGSASPAAVGTMSSTCDNWLSVSSTLNGQYGGNEMTTPFWFAWGSRPCNSTGGRIYCVEP